MSDEDQDWMPVPFEAPADGIEKQGIEHPADGTMSPELEGDGTGQALPPFEDEPVTLEIHDGFIGHTSPVVK
jgi:hypothetical protein